MIEPPHPERERDRLEALRSYRILDTLPEQAYDDLVGLASYIAGTPIALVSLVDATRQWFKARVGLDAGETPRAISFCGHAVADGAELIVPDAARDARFRDNPLVVGPPNVAFYAGFPLTNPGGHVLGTLCVIDRASRELDAGQKQHLRALARHVMELLELRKASEERRISQRFFELSLDLLCVAGHDGYFHRLNPAFSRVLGFSLEELQSRPFMDFIHPDDREAAGREIAKLAGAGHETHGFECRFQRSDGTYRCLAWNAAPDPDSETMMAVARDVTDARAAEAALVAAKLEAEAGEQAKSAFLATMSHELRTPLNSVIGFAQLLSRDRRGVLSPREVDYADRIVRNGQHLLSIINDILDLSKAQSGRIELATEEVELVELATQVVGSLEPLARDGATAVRVVASGTTWVAGDRQRLRQVLVNLVGNALKFAAGGRVEVRVVCGEGGRGERIDVVDDGIGLSADRFDDVFGAFQQVEQGADRRHDGTGLGLTISRALARAHGFELAVASRLGEGATFSLLLGEGAEVPEHAPPSAVEAPP